MHAIKQKCRPKHQVLILKCYPSLPKNSSPAEIKPNSSELSYLLYYASARRSKLSKVGIFLEQRTARDVYKSRTPTVQITLQILTAFLNSPGVGGTGAEAAGGFGLFAPFVLRILREILTHASETSLIESCLPVWDAFCRHQNHVALSADAEYLSLYSELVALWAGYAAKDASKAPNKARLNASPGDAIRLRKAGLLALKSIADADALGTAAGKQLDIVLPVLLQNLYGQQGDIAYLAAREQQREMLEKEHGFKRRQSRDTVRTTEDGAPGNPKAAEGTAADADKIAEEETGVVALQCLKRIFAVENRAQVRNATAHVLTFIARHQTRQAQRPARNSSVSWAMKLFETVCDWTPVQDRFVAVFTAVETLISSRIVEDELRQQIVLSQVIGHVLASDINLIGLSIMDVLLGLIQHVLLILQLGTGNAAVATPEVLSSDEDLKKTSTIESLSQGIVMQVVAKPSPARLELLAQLRRCIANLGTHVYYTDQISDMITAILLRLKPSPSLTQSAALTASAIEDPASAASEVANNASLRERPNTDGFFSFDTAREVALNAVKDIIAVANSALADGSHIDNNRTAIPISVWEGTQWMLRDTSVEVRKAYVDALCTWLKLETRQSDVRLHDDRATTGRERKYEGNLARRAASTASASQRAARKGRSTFLQLLHLAVYEDALQNSKSILGDQEMLLLHLLLTNTVQRLGVNAVRTGLPMVLRLQDDIPSLESQAAKIRISSLVYGYLWAVCETFDFEQSVTGREVQSHIASRKSQGSWLDGIVMPPLAVEQVSTASQSEKVALSSDPLRPFQHRQDIIDRIATSYASLASTPPPSAPTSPGRSFSLPALTVAAATAAASSSSTSSKEPALPQAVLDELSVPWSRETLLSSIAAAAPKSVSLSGSRVGRSHTFGAGINDIPSGLSQNPLMLGNHRSLLASANTFPLARATHGTPPLNMTGSAAGGSPGSGSNSGPIIGGRGPRAMGQHRGVAQRPASRSPASIGGRSRGSTSASRPSGSEYASGGPGRVEELKRVLAGGGAAAATGRTTPVRGAGARSYVVDDDDDGDGDTGSESMMDYDDDGDGDGDMSFAGGEEDVLGRSPRALVDARIQTVDHAVPAAGLDGGGGVGSPSWQNGGGSPVARRGRSIRGLRDGGAGFGGRKMDLGSLLSSIDVGEGDEGDAVGTGMARPPY